MRTVKEVSALSGVSIRTLHHYDAIDLLKPTQVTAAGYRLYDDAALRRLQSILLFRELQFPLKEIKAILDGENFDPASALEQQIQLLEMQKQRIEALIALARSIRQKGGSIMNFQAFDHKKIDQYKAEAKEKWGRTEGYAAYEKKEKAGGDMDRAARQLMQRLGEIGALQRLSPAAPAVQEKVAALQAFITENFYPCTNEIFRSLGDMYTGDERFRQNIDAAGGDGTAAFISQAIQIHCGKE